MKIIRAAQCHRMLWKNGGGETIEIATDPDGAKLDNFTWRLSAARVAQTGPFSLFPGIQRTLAVLSGEGLELRTPGTTVRLGPSDKPFSFSGDEPTEGRLLDGPVEDLNIMTRRGAARHRMRRVLVSDQLRISAEAATSLLFCADGQVSVEGETVAARDTAVLTRSDRGFVQAMGQGVLYLIEIDADT